MRVLISPSAGSTVIGTVKSDSGGLGSVDVAGMKLALNAVSLDKINQPNGILGLDENGLIPSSMVPNDGVTQIGVMGLIETFVGTVNSYLITNFDIFTTYTLSAVSGSVTRVKDTITYAAPNTVMPGGFYINGRLIPINIKASGIITPSITNPVFNATGVPINYTFTSSAYTTAVELSNHQSTDWQISTSPDFSTTFRNIVNDTANKVSLPVIGLVISTTYYVRVRFKSSLGTISDWSTGLKFTT